MDDAPILRLSTPLPLPSRGGLVRARCGPCEALLEPVRGGFAFLWSDGRTAQRLHLGLAAAGDLRLELRPPGEPVAVTPQEPVLVAPAARVRGYLLVPVVPTLVWQPAGGEPVALHAFAPPALAAEWRLGAGHGFVATSPWCARFPARAASLLQAVLPVRIRNDGPRPHDVAAVPIERDSVLHACRGGLAFAVADLVAVGDRMAPRQRNRPGGTRTISVPASFLELPA
ncbi:MAG: hypothetical protein ACK58X_07230 [Planctomycetota bacterium]